MKDKIQNSGGISNATMEMIYNLAKAGVIGL